MAVELATGELPWRRIKLKAEVEACKAATSISQLVTGLPPIFADFGCIYTYSLPPCHGFVRFFDIFVSRAHVESLTYEDEPAYPYLIDCFSRCAVVEDVATRTDLCATAGAVASSGNNGCTDARSLLHHIPLSWDVTVSSRRGNRELPSAASAVRKSDNGNIKIISSLTDGMPANAGLLTLPLVGKGRCFVQG